MGYISKTLYITIFAVGIYYFKQYMNGGICMSKARIDGKVVIITGANTGIGKETAKDLVQRGARVYLACRSVQKAELAAEDIRQETGANVDDVRVMRLDLASLRSVREFAHNFKTKEKKLDILINNAGLILHSPERTEDGFETTFGVNHLGHFLLTHLLMDPLLAASKSRIVVVSSLAHGFQTINFDDLMFEKQYGGYSAYSQSKMANMLFARELANRLMGSGVTVYSLHPGMVKTEVNRDSPYYNSTIISFILSVAAWPVVKEPWNGAQTTICCAVDENLANETGKYYSDCQQKEPYAEAQDDEEAKKLWDISIKLVKLDPTEIHPKLL